MKSKIEAKKAMLKKLKSMMRDESYEPKKEEMKKMKKVTVMSDSEEGLEEGLSKAQKIMKAKKESEGEDYECGGGKYEDGGISNYKELKDDELKYKKDMLKKKK